MSTYKTKPFPLPYTRLPREDTLDCLQLLRPDSAASAILSIYLLLSLHRQLLFPNHSDANIDNLQFRHFATLPFSGSHSWQIDGLFLFFSPFFFSPPSPKMHWFPLLILGRVSGGAQRLHVHCKLRKRMVLLLGSWPSFVEFSVRELRTRPILFTGGVFPSPISKS